jgi:hypothetical protein
VTSTTGVTATIKAHYGCGSGAADLLSRTAYRIQKVFKRSLERASSKFCKANNSVPSLLAHKMATTKAKGRVRNHAALLFSASRIKYSSSEERY